MPATLEDQVAELRSEIDKRKSTASEKRAAAEQHMLAEKAKNPGLLTDTSDAGRSAFETIQAGYKEADTLDQEAETLKARLNTILDENAGDAISASGGDPSHPQIVRARNIGQIATASKQYESLLASNALKTEGARIDFDPVEVLAYDEAARFLASGRVHLADVGDGSPRLRLRPDGESDAGTNTEPGCERNDGDGVSSPIAAVATAAAAVMAVGS